MQYTLMHREIPVLDIDITDGVILSLGSKYDLVHIPLGCMNKGIIDRKALNDWWKNRSIPASREGIREALAEIGLSFPQELVSKCYGLSLSDQHWVCPKGSNLEWKQLNFFDNSFSEDIGNVLFGDCEGSDSISFFSPDSTLEGQLKKRWKIADGKRILIKGGSNPYRQQPINEVIASRIADRLGIAHTEYFLTDEHEKPCCYCEDFITSETELISAHHIMSAFKRRSDISEYEFYISCCEQFGVRDIRRRLEEMLVLDYLIVNTDRHFNNFGLIRNAVTLEWIGAAPIFDCGNSLWFNTVDKKILANDTELKAKVFKKTQSEILSLITDFDWLDLSKLDGIEAEFDELLSTSEYISDERRSALCRALRGRVDLLNDFIHEQSQDMQIKLM